MKKVIYLALALLFSSLVSCTDKDTDDDVIWDYAPYILKIDIVDSEGNNLLDPEVKGNVIDEGIAMSYNDRFYEMYTGESNRSRYYLPHFFGLELTQGRYYDEPALPWQLWWGEFDRAKNKTYNFSLHFLNRNCLPNEFELKIEDKGKGQTEIELKVNGKKADAADHYTIVL